ISADDQLVLYDALNSLQLAGGGRVEVWSIYALDRATGQIFAIVPPQPGVDVGYPALAQRSDNFLVFDAVDIASSVGSVLAGNLDTGVLTTVASGLDGFAVPGYNGDDTRVIYSAAAATPSAYSLLAQPVSGRVTPQGDPVGWIADADYSAVYRRGAFVPEPGAGALGAVTAVALAVLAHRRAGRGRRAAP
ncbi:MAG TPA: hypothetical protein VLC53_12400, partial [Myxococcota bacterium]|nr:hypothetical protein [Myxococcota bacterium]